MTSLALSFNDVKFNPIVQCDGQIWLSSGELAQALDYKTVKSVSNLYSSNKDEFSDSITQVIESVTSVISLKYQYKNNSNRCNV